MFKKWLLEKPCIIPATGYYEWQVVTGQKKKDKYLLQLPQNKLLYLAGMTGIFKDRQGSIYEAFVILTTAANDSVSAIH
ncbi:MAG: SOS response-associated peptidase, partial [Prolixibacteraceae bacterium]|nr:SOS response-associated peptidase [Prolixibacteraceae bacterium]